MDRHANTPDADVDPANRNWLTFQTALQRAHGNGVISSKSWLQIAWHTMRERQSEHNNHKSRSKKKGDQSDASDFFSSNKHRKNGGGEGGIG